MTEADDLAEVLEIAARTAAREATQELARALVPELLRALPERDITGAARAVGAALERLSIPVTVRADVQSPPVDARVTIDTEPLAAATTAVADAMARLAPALARATDEAVAGRAAPPVVEVAPPDLVGLAESLAALALGVEAAAAQHARELAAAMAQACQALEAIAATITAPRTRRVRLERAPDGTLRGLTVTEEASA